MDAFLFCFVRVGDLVGEFVDDFINNVGTAPHVSEFAIIDVSDGGGEQEDLVARGKITG